MNAYATIAQIYGKVDPKDEVAVQQFFEETFPTLSPEKQQEIVDELFFKTTGLGSDQLDEQNLDTEATPEHPSNELTTLQKRILALIARGHSNAEVAQYLELSQSDIKDAIIDIWNKLELPIKKLFPSDIETNDLINTTESRSPSCQLIISHYLYNYLKNPHWPSNNLQRLSELVTSRSHRS
jgi:DNA-binding CsgD family transcriptional regulator